MASIFKNKHWNSFGIEIVVNHKRKRFYDFQTRKEAGFAKYKLEELLAAPQVRFRFKPVFG